MARHNLNANEESILNSLTLLAAGQEVSLLTLGNLAGVLLEVCMEVGREDLAVKLRDHLAMATLALKQ